MVTIFQIMKETSAQDASSIGHRELVQKRVELTKRPMEEELLRKIAAQSLIDEFKRVKLEKEARRNWDKFYRRNADHFFKDRNWTKVGIEELCGSDVDLKAPLTLIDAGCGCGNTIFPLLNCFPHWHFYGLDFSQNAIDLFRERAHKLGAAKQVIGLVADLLEPATDICARCADLVSLIFVLSSISPKHHNSIVMNLRKMLKPAGSVIFRDYAAFDHAMLRFNKNSKISERFYVRQDGTRAYYFYTQEVRNLFEDCGFHTVECSYVYRTTKNVKEQICIERIFIEGRFKINA